MNDEEPDYLSKTLDLIDNISGRVDILEKKFCLTESFGGLKDETSSGSAEV